MPLQIVYSLFTLSIFDQFLEGMSESDADGESDDDLDGGKLRFWLPIKNSFHFPLSIGLKAPFPIISKQSYLFLVTTTVDWR